DALKSADDQQRASFQNVADIVTYIEYWKRVATHRRQLTKDDKSKQLGSEKDNAVCCSRTSTATTAPPKMRKAPRRRFERGVSGRDLADREERRNLNRSLLQYFISVSTPGSDDYSDSLDSQFVQSLLERGASLNTRDRYGQTVLHEVAKNWNPAVMELMIRCGGDPNAGDFLGRTPLHVAAASNYLDMCRLLVRRGANSEALTSNGQTPLFLAAKTDSVKSLLALMQLGCQFDRVYDSRGRTPLYAAAELDRSETAAILIERGGRRIRERQFRPDCVRSNGGENARLAKEALSQFALQVPNRSQSNVRFVSPVPNRG
uniref:ANK_REP_REGION domain-containing protein n=1 Tax=Macrostomum lignano TaxID=282301 RepID=A0A1I8FM43_9PLAT